jgi:hypothetical protein
MRRGKTVILNTRRFKDCLLIDIPNANQKLRWLLRKTKQDNYTLREKRRPFEIRTLRIV